MSPYIYFSVSYSYVPSPSISPELLEIKLPFLASLNLPNLGPSIMAPVIPAAPPTRCTIPDPAKSTYP